MDRPGPLSLTPTRARRLRRCCSAEQPPTMPFPPLVAWWQTSTTWPGSAPGVAPVVGASRVARRLPRPSKSVRPVSTVPQVTLPPMLTTGAWQRVHQLCLPGYRCSRTRQPGFARSGYCRPRFLPASADLILAVVAVCLKTAALSRRFLVTGGAGCRKAAEHRVRSSRIPSTGRLRICAVVGAGRPSNIASRL